MQRILSVTGLLLVILTANADTKDTNALIALDKQWGESSMKGDTAVAAKLYADTLIAVDNTGVRGKKAELANNQAAPAGERYEPTDYKVTFIDKNTAIMTHGTKGADAHYSLHVWSRKGDTWQIVATSTTPVSKAR